MEVSSGTQLGSYEILSPLGSGGMGQVWRARHLMLDRQAAIKLIRPESLEPGAGEQANILLRRFEREAKATSALRSPHTVQVYDYGTTDDGTFYYAMELLEGCDLRSLVERHGSIAAGRVIYVLRQACESLAEAHRNGLIHHDIKPANIFLTEVGFKYDFVKVLDFGLVRRTPGSDWKGSRLTVEGVVAGSPAFMAPELIRGSSTIDERVDIYSLGCVAYWVLTGQLVFEGDTALQIMAAHLEQSPAPPSTRSELEIPTALDQIVMACLEKDPARRPQSVEALSRQLAECSVKEPWTERRAEEWWRVHQPSKAPVERASGEGTTLGRYISRKPGSAVEEEAKPRALSRRRVLAGAVAILLALLVGMNLGSWREWLLGDAGQVRIKSLAVLPLENLSDDPEQEYFADGMTEALIADLASIRALKVISRTSVMRYKETEKSLPEIARELGVDGVIEGSVMRAGDRVRITVQLIDAATDENLWAESYERNMRDVLALQREVARTIAREIRILVTSVEGARLARARPVNPEAYELYLRGRFHVNKYTEEGYRQALVYFQQSIEKDPDYGAAHAGLAQSHGLLAAFYGLQREAWPKAESAVLKALEIDESLAESHVSLALIRQYRDWDWAAAEREYRRAIELNPGYVTAHHEYAAYLTAMGRSEEAIAEIQRARELDPLSLVVNQDLAWIYYRARDYNRAIDQLRKTLELDRNFADAHRKLGWVFAATGQFEKAVAEMQQAVTLSSDPIMLASLGRVYAVSGKHKEALTILEELVARPERIYLSPYVALIYVGLEETDQAIEWLEQAYEEHHGQLIYLKDPRWDPLRSDPRFQDLLRRMNFPG